MKNFKESILQFRNKNLILINIMSIKKTALVTPYPPIQSGVSEYAK
jgi:hypothetical protein